MLYTPIYSHKIRYTGLKIDTGVRGAELGIIVDYTVQYTGKGIQIQPIYGHIQSVYMQIFGHKIRQRPNEFSSRPNRI